MENEFSESFRTERWLREVWSDVVGVGRMRRDGRLMGDWNGGRPWWVNFHGEM